MIGTIDVEIQAANPSMPLFPMRAFEGSPSSIRVRNVPTKIGKWSITKVYFQATYPDNSTKSVECKLTGGVWVGTIDGCDSIGYVKNGYSIFADGNDENGNAVTNYCLGKGDVTILDANGIIERLPEAEFVQILSAQPTSPNDGDMWQTNGAWYIWQNSQAWPIGDDSGLIGELSAEIQTKAETSVLTSYALSSDVANGLSNKADISSISDFTTSSEVCAIVSQKTIDVSGFILPPNVTIAGQVPQSEWQGVGTPGALHYEIGTPNLENYEDAFGERHYYANVNWKYKYEWSPVIDIPEGFWTQIGELDEDFNSDQTIDSESAPPLPWTFTFNSTGWDVSVQYGKIQDGGKSVFGFVYEDELSNYATNSELSTALSSKADISYVDSQIGQVLTEAF